MIQKMRPKMVKWTQNQASAMAIPVPWPKPVGWAEEERAQEDQGLWIIWKDSVKRNGLRFCSLYSTTLLDVMGEVSHKGSCTKF